MTSSKTSSAPDASQRRRSDVEKVIGSGGTTPMFPATGSTMIAASPSPYCATAAAARSTSLNRTHDRVGGHGGRHARARRQRERRNARARAREQCVSVAVVAARELEDPVSRRERAGEPDRAHRRLGPRRDEPDLLDRRHRVDDLRCELDLRFCRRAEARPTRSRVAHGLNCLGVAMTEEQRPPRHHPVDVAAPVTSLRGTPPRRAGRRSARRARRHASRAPAS